MGRDGVIACNEPPNECPSRADGDTILGETGLLDYAELVRINLFSFCKRAASPEAATMERPVESPFI
jgi:hypothetical protein